MKKAILIVTVLFIAVISTACINNFAVQELNNKAKTYLDNGDYDAAINRLQASLDLDGSIFETNYNLGIAYIKAKRYKNAVETLSNAVKLNSDFADSYYSLAIAQESYAEELIEMNSDKTVSNENSEDGLVDTEIKHDSVDIALIPQQRVEKAVVMYNLAKESYSTYLLKSSSPKDADEINNQIKSIEDRLSKYGRN